MKIYTSKSCLNCISLKQILKKNKIDYEEIDGTINKSIAYLRARKVNILQLPIIEEDNKFFTFDEYILIINDQK